MATISNESAIEVRQSPRVLVEILPPAARIASGYSPLFRPSESSNESTLAKLVLNTDIHRHVESANAVASKSERTGFVMVRRAMKRRNIHHATMSDLQR
jgi:hypothetical protein